MVTAVVLDRPLRGAAAQLALAREQYRAAFELRSTVRQREASLDHLTDLSHLLADDRGKELADLVAELSSFARAL